MSDSYQNIDSGQSELKNFYSADESQYEAIRRRRKRLLEKMGIDEDDGSRDKTPSPSPEY